MRVMVRPASIAMRPELVQVPGDAVRLPAAVTWIVPEFEKEVLGSIVSPGGLSATIVPWLLMTPTASLPNLPRPGWCASPH